MKNKIQKGLAYRKEKLKLAEYDYKELMIKPFGEVNADSVQHAREEIIREQAKIEILEAVLEDLESSELRETK